jgi:hypothetical protein
MAGRGRPFTQGTPRPANSGRKQGARNKRTVPAEAYPDALAHLTAVMTAKDDPLITPELKLRAAIGLAAYQRPKPTPSHTEASVAVEGYEEPKTVEEARALILTLGARLAKGEVSVQAHDALINGLKAYLGDKASSPDSKPLCALGKAHELREQSYPPRAGARSGGRRRHGGGGRR